MIYKNDSIIFTSVVVILSLTYITIIYRQYEESEILNLQITKSRNYDMYIKRSKKITLKIPKMKIKMNNDNNKRNSSSISSSSISSNSISSNSISISSNSISISSNSISISSNSISISSRNNVQNSNVPRRILIITMITDDVNSYTSGALKLISSMKRNLTAEWLNVIHFGVLELTEKPLAANVKHSLTSAGWDIIISVNAIHPRNIEGTFPRFRDQFSKLHLWNMTEYDRVLYLDSDTLCVGSIIPLLEMNISTKPLWVARDIRDSIWQDGFNMGVFMITPNADEFDRLLQLKNNNLFIFETGMAEQGFLNVVYQNNWGDIGFVNNANLAAYVQDKNTWNNFYNDLNIIHYTMSKPWNCEDAYTSVCLLWQQI
jgi:hypothetical protein